MGFAKQFPGRVALDISATHRDLRDGYTLVDINGIYPSGPNQPFGGFGLVDPNRGQILQENNRTWALRELDVIEATLAKNLSHNFQGTLSVTRQWQSIQGTWGPTDPARFIQPDAFANNHDLSQYLFGNGDTNTLSGGGRESGVAYRPYSIRLAGQYLAPYHFTIGVSYVDQAGGWVGPVVTQLSGANPVFGPALVTLANGTTQSNPLATTIRYCGVGDAAMRREPDSLRRADAERGRAVSAASCDPRLRHRAAPVHDRSQHLQRVEQRRDDAVEHRRQSDLLAELPVTVQSDELTSGAVHLQVDLLIVHTVPASRDAGTAPRPSSTFTRQVGTIMPKARRSFFITVVVMLVIVAAYLTPGSAQQAPRVNPDLYSQLRWRFIGPEGNRISAVAGVPGDPLRVLRRQRVRRHLQDHRRRRALGADLRRSAGRSRSARSPSRRPIRTSSGPAPAKRGSAATSRSATASTSRPTPARRGRGWASRRPDASVASSSIRRIPTIVLACALGHGLRSAAGARRVPHDRRRQRRGSARCSSTRTPAARTSRWTRATRASCSPACGRSRSTRGDATAAARAAACSCRATAASRGRSSPATACRPSTGRQGHAGDRAHRTRIAIYAIDRDRRRPSAGTGRTTDRGQLWRSDDGGDNWQMVSSDRNCAGPHALLRAHGRVARQRERDVLISTRRSASRSTAARRCVAAVGPRSAGRRHHDMWIDPTNGNRMVVAHDQGVSISQNRGRTWLKQQLPIAQMYHVTVDNQIPYYVYGNKQDGPSYRGPSNSRLDEGGGRGGGGGARRIPRGMWHAIGGGESGWATPDPVDPNIIWSTASGSGSVGGIVVRYDESRAAVARRRGLAGQRRTARRRPI